MRKFVLFIAASLVLFTGVVQAQAAATAHAPDLVGNWQGTLAVGKGLRIVLRVSKGDGKLKVAMLSTGDPKPIGHVDSLAGSAVTLRSSS